MIVSLFYKETITSYYSPVAQPVEAVAAKERGRASESVDEAAVNAVQVEEAPQVLWEEECKAKAAVEAQAAAAADAAVVAKAVVVTDMAAVSELASTASTPAMDVDTIAARGSRGGAERPDERITHLLASVDVSRSRFKEGQARFKRLVDEQQLQKKSAK